MLAKFAILIRYIKWGSISICVFVGVGLAASPFWLYQQFDQETPVAQLSAFPDSGNSYLLNISFLDTCNSQIFEINSNQVQVDASFLKWKSWLTALGVSPIYQLDRLSARETLDTKPKSLTVILDSKENDTAPRRYDLRPELVLPVFESNALDGSSTFWVDTQYGSSVYFDIDTALVYTIFATEDGLILKSKQKKPLIDAQGALIIDIDRSCSGEPSLWHKSLAWLNKSILWLF